MTHREYGVVLDSDVRYRVRFDMEKGRVTEFVAQLEFGGEENWTPVLRYDTAHGFPHCDRHKPDQTVSRHEPMALTDFNQALTFAVGDILANWEDYVRDFREHVP